MIHPESMLSQKRAVWDQVDTQGLRQLYSDPTEMPSRLATSLTVKLSGGNSFFNTDSFLSGEYRVTHSSLALCSINDEFNEGDNYPDTGGWREHYNQVRPHSSLNYLPPVVFAQQAA